MLAWCYWCYNIEIKLPSAQLSQRSNTLRCESLFANCNVTGMCKHKLIDKLNKDVSRNRHTGCPVYLVLKQGAVNQLFLEVFLMFLACLDHARWAQFHLGILGPQEWKKIQKSYPEKSSDFRVGSNWHIFWFLSFRGCQLWDQLSQTILLQF